MSSMSCARSVRLSRGSTLSPITFVFRLSSSPPGETTGPSPVVQTGVGSAHSRNGNAQLLPFQQ